MPKTLAGLSNVKVEYSSISTGKCQVYIMSHLHGLTSLYLFLLRFSGFFASPIVKPSAIAFKDDSLRIFWKIK